jgi:hypothetical protein
VRSLAADVDASGATRLLRFLGQDRRALKLFRRAVQMAARHHHVRGEIEAAAESPSSTRYVVVVVVPSLCCYCFLVEACRCP